MAKIIDFKEAVKGLRKRGELPKEWEKTLIRFEPDPEAFGLDEEEEDSTTAESTEPAKSTDED